MDERFGRIYTNDIGAEHLNAHADVLVRVFDLNDDVIDHWKREFFYLEKGKESHLEFLDDSNRFFTYVYYLLVETDASTQEIAAAIPVEYSYFNKILIPMKEVLGIPENTRLKFFLSGRKMSEEQIDQDNRIIQMYYEMVYGYFSGHVFVSTVAKYLTSLPRESILIRVSPSYKQLKFALNRMGLESLEDLHSENVNSHLIPILSTASDDLNNYLKKSITFTRTSDFLNLIERLGVKLDYSSEGWGVIWDLKDKTMKEAEKVRMINAVIIPRLFSNDKFKERLIESVLSSVFYPLRGIGIEVPFEFPNFIFISGIVDEMIMKYYPNLKKDDYREAHQAGRPSPRIFKRVRTEVKLKSLLEYLISLHVNELPKEL